MDHVISVAVAAGDEVVRLTVRTSEDIRADLLAGRCVKVMLVG